MISNTTYRYFLVFITVFAFYQLLFFYLIRPYYLKQIYARDSKVKLPEVAFEAVYLMILILGLAVAPIVSVSPYLLWSVVLLVYGLAINRSHSQSFFLASALVFKIHRDLKPEKQFKYQRHLIFIICSVSGVLFLLLSLLLK